MLLSGNTSGNKEVNLHKDKSFMIPFIVVSVIILLSTLIL